MWGRAGGGSALRSLFSCRERIFLCVVVDRARTSGVARTTLLASLRASGKQSRRVAHEFALRRVRDRNSKSTQSPSPGPGDSLWQNSGANTPREQLRAAAIVARQAPKRSLGGRQTNVQLVQFVLAWGRDKPKTCI